MNILGIDYGSKHIGLAFSVKNIIQPLSVLKNDSTFLPKLKQVIDDYKIEKIYVGISEGLFAQKTQEFVNKLKNMLTLPVETVEESVSTIEANEIFSTNQKKKKNYKKTIDSIAAAVILRRVIN